MAFRFVFFVAEELLLRLVDTLGTDRALRGSNFRGHVARTPTTLSGKNNLAPTPQPNPVGLLLFFETEFEQCVQRRS